ncbi:hypothetical protein L1987_85218 [Smallanthus sonchifolius]|uniref:Uncharacterized protein n=1 Tax=Smallanthus sonchifolius TaxID=185202 RepID=A0ACB8XVU5_9ASTR|nr:hypothetical protein L1987_85218 [Smallanthus sonchifolius]
MNSNSFPLSSLSIFQIFVSAFFKNSNGNVKPIEAAITASLICDARHSWFNHYKTFSSCETAERRRLRVTDSQLLVY